MDKIVLIEDDPGIRTVIRLALKGAGFTSICEAGNGTGLGPAIVKHIAQLHGGQAAVLSKPGKGATFTLVI